MQKRMPCGPARRAWKMTFSCADRAATRPTRRAEPGLCLFRPLAACLCAHCQRRHRCRAAARRACWRAHRQGHGRESAASAAIRRSPAAAASADPAAPAGARRRAGMLRRAGRHGGRRDAAAAQDAAELVAVDYEALPAGHRRAARRSSPARRNSGRRRPAISRSTGPDSPPDPEAQCARGRRDLRSAAQIRRARRGDQPAPRRSPRWSRAAPPRATIAATDRYTLRVCSQGARRAARQHRRHHGHAEGAAARPHRGCRRRLRPEDRRLSGIPRAAGRREESSAGRCTGCRRRSEAFLSDNQARDTFTEAELALDEKGKLPGAAHPPHRQYRRLYRLGRRQHPDHEFRPLLSRHVRHPAHRRRRALRLHQHGADRALSRRRAAGGELRARARGRGGRARHRHRSGQAAAAQSDPGLGDAVQDRGRHHLRQRRFRSRSSTRRWRLPTTTASSSASARRARRGKLRGIGISCMLEHAGGAPTEGAALDVPGRRHADRSGSTCSRPARATPRSFRASPPSGSASPTRARSATGTATRAWKSPATPRSARARR